MLYFAVACASYVLFMNIACMLLQPQLFDHPHWGISYFGSLARTLLPYYGGIAIIIACLSSITYELRRTNKGWRFLYRAFWAVTGLTIYIALSSPMRGAFLWWSHIVVCFVLLLVALATEVRVLLKPGARWYEYVWMLLLIGGTVLLNLSADWANVLGIYAWSEMILFVAVLLALGTAAVRAIDATEVKS